MLLDYTGREIPIGVAAQHCTSSLYSVIKQMAMLKVLMNLLFLDYNSHNVHDALISWSLPNPTRQFIIGGDVLSGASIARQL